MRYVRGGSHMSVNGWSSRGRSQLVECNQASEPLEKRAIQVVVSHIDKRGLRVQSQASVVQRGGEPNGVVVAVEPLAADAGASVMRKGGNAMDACIAASFAQGVVDPIACGIGGTLHSIFLDGATGRITAIDGGGRAPGAAHETLWEASGNWMTQFRVRGEGNRWGHSAATTPGFVRGAAMCLELCGSGRISWSEVIQPAIALATDGFEVYPYLYRQWMPNQYSNGFLGEGPRTLGFTEAGARIFLHTDGTVLRIGERLIQADYATTLDRIATQGPDEFYIGETGYAIARDFAKHDGLLTAGDLESYRSRVIDTLTGTFHDVSFATTGAPTLGPTFLAIMNILEGCDLASLEFNSPSYLDKVARAIHLPFRDRARYIGDPEFVRIPSHLTTKEYAAELRDEIDRSCSERVGEGDAVRYGSTLPGHTTHVTAVDFAGNAACITHSIGSGSGAVTPGLGFMHNNHMIMFDPRPGRPNSIAPYKRANGGGDPLLVFRNSELFLAIGSPAGGRKTTAITQILLNVLLYGASLQNAIAADRIHCEEEAMTITVEPNFPSDLALDLARRGFAIEVDSYTARVVGIQRDYRAKALLPGVDPRCAAGVAIG
jgi:gamma-glutamyltranspeptidase / glutathione hydrolase